MHSIQKAQVLWAPKHGSLFLSQIFMWFVFGSSRHNLILRVRVPNTASIKQIFRWKHLSMAGIKFFLSWFMSRASRAVVSELVTVCLKSSHTWNHGTCPCFSFAARPRFRSWHAAVHACMYVCMYMYMYIYIYIYTHKNTAYICICSGALNNTNSHVYLVTQTCSQLFDLVCTHLQKKSRRPIAARSHSRVIDAVMLWCCKLWPVEPDTFSDSESCQIEIPQWHPHHFPAFCAGV